MNTTLKAVSVNGEKYLAGNVEQPVGKVVLTDAMTYSGGLDKSDFQKYAVAELDKTLIPNKSFSGGAITVEEIQFTPEQVILLANTIAIVDLALTQWQDKSKANYLRSVFQ